MSDKEEKRPRLEKMVDASEYKKKENSLTRALSVFLPEDEYDLKDYIINGIVVPMIKDGLEDIGHTLIRGSGRRKTSSRRGRRYYDDDDDYRPSYRKYYDDRRRERYDDDDRYYRSECTDFKNVKFGNRGDAERVLARLEDIIYKNRYVSLLDFYDLTGQPTRSTDSNYGWTNLDRARVDRLRGDNGYIIHFPSPMPLDFD